MPNKPSSVEFADTISDLMNGIAGWLLIGLGTAAFLSGFGGLFQYAGTADIVVPVLVLLFSFVFITSGMLVNPRFRRRLDRRHEVSRFGRVQSVDSRVLSESEYRVESCTSCDAKMREGLIRRYREEYTAAGVPIWTLSENHNFYCPSCAAEEISGPTLTDHDDDLTTEQVVTEVE
jgi:transcription elongation factor Elf1